MGRKLLYPKFTDIRRMLTKAIFNPNERSPLSVVLQEGDSRYFEIKACELIREAMDLRKGAENQLTISNHWWVAYEDKMLKATQLITLARVDVENNYVPKVGPALGSEFTNRD